MQLNMTSQNEARLPQRKRTMPISLEMFISLLHMTSTMTVCETVVPVCHYSDGQVL